MHDSPALPLQRRLETAEILSIGTELTSGETRDTNAGELARSLTEVGVEVTRLTALPDRRERVESAFRAALERVDLVVSSGGLGPTPDDLTRESIAAVCDEIPEVDPALERWLRSLWERRGLPFSAINLKQAWRIPSASTIANPNGTAPGWWVDRPDGRVVILLPGPPSEMRPMWQATLTGRLHERGLGADRQVRTLRLTGIGESAVADRLGDEILRQRNPEVTTYARWDAVDVRLAASAVPASADQPGTSAAALLDAVEAVVLDVLGSHVWARGTTAWPEAIGTRPLGLDSGHPGGGYRWCAGSAVPRPALAAARRVPGRRRGRRPWPSDGRPGSGGRCRSSGQRGVRWLATRRSTTGRRHDRFRRDRDADPAATRAGDGVP